MADQVVKLTHDQLTALAEKLDRVGEALDPRERQALMALLTAAIHEVGAEVTGYERGEPEATLEIAIAESLSTATLGDGLRLLETPVD